MKRVEKTDGDRNVTLEIDEGLLVRFLKKETTREENKAVYGWASRSEKNKTKLRTLHETYHMSMDDGETVDTEGAWEKVSYRLPGRESENINSSILYWKVAACIAVLLVIGSGSLWVHKYFIAPPVAAMIRVEAPPGEKSKVVLPDGTLVWLNSLTILHYDAVHPRRAVLDGEAYFEVVKDPEHPFEVSTASGLKVIVLGTKFNLRSFSNERYVEATLEEGIITVTGIHSEKPVTLRPGQQASYDTASKSLKVRNVSAEACSIWKNNELRFRDVSFRELVPLIERWYGVKITLGPGIGKEDRFTMTIKTESLRELLKMMQLTSNFSYGINGEKVTIYAR